MRRADMEIASRDIPLKIRLMPTSVPITHSVLAGHVQKIIKARTRVTTPSNTSQPDPCTGRSSNASE